MAMPMDSRGSQTSARERPSDVGIQSRTWKQRGAVDCAPVAIYNLVQILGLKSLAGGYRANEQELQIGCRFDSLDGSPPVHTVRTAKRVLGEDGLTLIKRRPTWRNIIGQLERAPSRGRVGAGLLRFKLHDGIHICPIYLNRGLDRIAGCNVNVSKFPGSVELMMSIGGDSWWETKHCPGEDDLLEFWQVMRM